MFDTVNWAWVGGLNAAYVTCIYQAVKYIYQNCLFNYNYLFTVCMFSFYFDTF